MLDLPVLESPQAKGRVVEVARVATAPATAGSEPLAWIETADGRAFRLPDSLREWASTALAVALTLDNPFPASVEFGLLAGDDYAEIL